MTIRRRRLDKLEQHLDAHEAQAAQDSRSAPVLDTWLAGLSDAELDRLIAQHERGDGSGWPVGLDAGLGHLSDDELNRRLAEAERALATGGAL